MARPKQQAAFSDHVINDEELEKHMRIYLNSLPDDDEKARLKAGRKSKKEIGKIIEKRFAALIKQGDGDPPWIRVAGIGLINPKIVHHDEEKREEVIFYPGGEDKLVFEIKPAS